MPTEKATWTVPHHLALPQAGFHFKMDTKPQGIRVEDCEIHVCNILDGPNDCQQAWTPPKADATAFRLGVDSDDFDAVVACYADLSAEITHVFTAYAGVSPGVTSGAMLIEVADLKVLGGIRIDLNPDYFPPHCLPMASFVIKKPYAEDALSDTYNPSDESSAKFKPYGPVGYPTSAQCFQTHDYKKSRTTIGYETIGQEGDPPADHDLITVRRRLPAIWTGLWDSYAFHSTWFVSGVQRWRYTIFNSVIGQPPARPSVDAFAALCTPDDSAYAGTFWDLSMTADDDPLWRPQGELVNVPGGWGPEYSQLFVQDPTAYRNNAPNWWINTIRQQHVQKTHQWQFADGKMEQKWSGLHTITNMASDRFFVNRIEYLGFQNFNKMHAERWSSQSYGFADGGPYTRSRPAYESVDPKLGLAIYFDYRSDQGPFTGAVPNPEDDAPLLWMQSVGTDLGRYGGGLFFWKDPCIVDLKFRIYYDKERRYAGGGYFEGGSQANPYVAFTNPEYTENEDIFGNVAENPGSWFSWYPYYIGIAPSPAVAVWITYAKHDGSQFADWVDPDFLQKLEILVTSYHTTGHSSSQRTDLLTAGPITMTGEPDLPGPHYHVLPWLFGGTCLTVTGPTDLKWIRIYDA
jgi:hypothetical protein